MAADKKETGNPERVARFKRAWEEYGDFATIVRLARHVPRGVFSGRQAGRVGESPMSTKEDAMSQSLLTNTHRAYLDVVWRRIRYLEEELSFQKGSPVAWRHMTAEHQALTWMAQTVERTADPEHILRLADRITHGKARHNGRA